jgi:hypothetical protein
MPHDKIRDAARERMARTGERYAAARRAVIGAHRAAVPLPPGPPPGPAPAGNGHPAWFAISYRQRGIDRLTAWLDALQGTGPGTSGVTISPGDLSIRMGGFRLDLPRDRVRSARRSDAALHGTTGVHVRRGRWLINGSADGLVELTIDPPFTPGRGLSSGFRREPMDRLILSLDDPDGFLAAIGAAAP